MHFKVIEQFGPDDKESWNSYISWRGLDLKTFDSIDAILRPSLFEPESAEDWDNCVYEDFRTNLISNFSYAKQIYQNFTNAALVGVVPDIDSDYESQENLLGYDILDGYSEVSLLTNWGADEDDVFSKLVRQNGLIHDLNKCIEIRDILRNQFGEDSHACGCSVWAIYKSVV